MKIYICGGLGKVDGEWKADFGSQYFTEDFPYGWKWIKELAEKYKIETHVLIM